MSETTTAEFDTHTIETMAFGSYLAVLKALTDEGQTREEIDARAGRRFDARDILVLECLGLAELSPRAVRVKRKCVITERGKAFLAFAAESPS